MDWKAEGQIRLGYLLLRINSLADQTLKHFFDRSCNLSFVFHDTDEQKTSRISIRQPQARPALGSGKPAPVTEDPTAAYAVLIRSKGAQRVSSE